MLNTQETQAITIMPFDRQKQIELGTLRRCKCGFETLDRSEFRRHLYDSGVVAPPMGKQPRQFVHEQNMKGRKEAASQGALLEI